MNDAPCTWTLSEHLAFFQLTIKRPLSADEIALAQAVAEAHYFAHHLAELPARCPEGSQALVALDWGIIMVLNRRGDIELPQVFP
jgi:hypothetical protein